MTSASAYKEPNERLALLGYASSIISGNTVEGGLRSLTYKSIYAAKRVADLDWAKAAIVPQEPRLLRLMEKDIITEQHLTQLREELNTQAPATIAKTDDIKALSQKLEDDMKTLGAPSHETLQAIRGLGVKLDVNRQPEIKSVQVGVDVQRMENVPGFDASIYHYAAQRRRDEEQQALAEQQRKIEQENLRIQEEEQRRLMEMQQRDASVENSMMSFPDNPLDDPAFAMDAEMNMPNVYPDNFGIPVSNQLGQMPPMDPLYLQHQNYPGM